MGKNIRWPQGECSQTKKKEKRDNKIVWITYSVNLYFSIKTFCSSHGLRFLITRSSPFLLKKSFENLPNCIILFGKALRPSNSSIKAKWSSLLLWCEPKGDQV